MRPHLHPPLRGEEMLQSSLTGEVDTIPISNYKCRIRRLILLGVIRIQYFGSGKVIMDSGFSTILYITGETHLPCRMSSATSFMIPSWIAQLRPLTLWANSGLRKGGLVSRLLNRDPPG